MLMSFLDFSKAVPVTGICNNQFGQPCGAQQILHPVRSHGFACALCAMGGGYTSSTVPCSVGAVTQAKNRERVIMFPQGEPLGYMKLQLTQFQTPVARVEVLLKDGWTRLLRSGDGFFEPGHEQPYTAPVKGSPAYLLSILVPTLRSADKH